MAANEEKSPRADNDGGWKHILSAHLKDFVEFFWSEAYQAIDWARPYELLEQELMAIGVNEEIGKRYVDKLFKVHLLNGQEQWLLLHIEVQNTKDEAFPDRMFTYFYRIFDRYNKDIASMAVLADLNQDWRPNEYRRKIWGSEIIRKYEVIKLTDYQSQIEELKNHPNPFAMVVLVQLAAMESRPDDKQRLLTKLEFFRALHMHGWPFEKSMNMYKYLDTMLGLSPKYQVQYIIEAKAIDQEFSMDMNFTTIAERHGFEEGMQQGVQQGIQQGVQYGEASLLRNILKAKFKEVPDAYIKKIDTADVDTLNRWAINLIHAQSLDEIFKQ